MPATNPRLTITMQPSLAAVLKRLSTLTGNSQSSLIGEFMGQAMPALERMATILDAAVKLAEQGKAVPQEIGESLKLAQTRMEAQLELVLGDMETGVRPLLEHAEKVHRRGARDAGGPGAGAPGRGTRAPISNRGVTPHSKEKNTGKTRKIRKGGSHGSL